MKPFRFAVFGDTHYTLRPKIEGALLGAADDFARYAIFNDNLPRFAEKVRGNVQLAFHTGDRIQGGTDDPREDAESCRILYCGVPMRLARGSHDYATPTPRYGTFEHGGCRFILLDYTDWNPSQRDFLEDALQKGQSAQHVFVFSHAPIHAWGREFFDNPEYREDVQALLQKYRIDVFFCGHTHNQAFSWHSPGYLQAMLSTVGEPTGVRVPLTRYHALPAQNADNRFLWGLLEDSDPALLVVTVMEDNILMFQRLSLYDSMGFLLANHSFDESGIAPLLQEREIPRPLAKGELAHAKQATLVIFHTEKDGYCHAPISVNGISIGTLPPNCSYANRRRIPLPAEALRTLRECGNVVEIAPPMRPPFAIGSVSLEVELADGNWVRTIPSTQYVTCGKHRDFVYGARFARQIAADQPVRITLDFPEA